MGSGAGTWHFGTWPALFSSLSCFIPSHPVSLSLCLLHLLLCIKHGLDGPGRRQEMRTFYLTRLHPLLLPSTVLQAHSPVFLTLSCLSCHHFPVLSLPSFLPCLLHILSHGHFALYFCCFPMIGDKTDILSGTGMAAQHKIITKTTTLLTPL